MNDISRHVQVNIPFSMLWEDYLQLFVQHRLNPEIGIDAVALDKYDRSNFKTVAAKLQQEGLRVTIHGPFIDLSPGSPDPAVRALTRNRFEQLLRVIPILKPVTVVCHAGYDRQRYSYEKEAWLEAALGIWRWLGRRIHDAGSRLMLENVYEYDPEEMLFVLEPLDREQVGFCFDVGHQSAFGNGHLEAWIQSTGRHIEQVHLHDNQGLRDDHLALGAGHVDLERLFEFMRLREDKPITITLEPHRKEDLWKSLNYLKANRTFNRLLNRQ